MRAQQVALAVMLVACGGKSPKPAPIENTEKPTADESSQPGKGKTIQRMATGGVIELSGDRGEAMEQAAHEMSAHCGADAYTIIQEGEEAIGASQTAWRVHYECNK